MKFPSVFPTTKNKRFHIEPRYYDPVKEDIDKRTRIIAMEMANQKESKRPSRLEGAFKYKSQHGLNTSLLQFLIMLMLSVLIVGYLYFGNTIFYVFLIFAPIYVFIRLKKKK